ncbi:MAG: peptidyl-dipeptidase Dcp [Chitinophagaceae bacterium]|nr:peptidyl-dipeptidase Dcp [Chitinophagaceae bacterium]
MLLIGLNSVGQQANLPATNPFGIASTLPYQAPPFNKIRNEDYRPAMEAGIARQLNEIAQIADNPAPPTFENTFVALEKSGQLLTRVNNVFNMVVDANNNDVLKKLKEDIAPKLAGLQDAIYLNTKLFHRVERIYNDRKKLKLAGESLRLTEYYYEEFILAGARLSETDKALLKKLNGEEAALSAKFSNQLQGAAKDAAVVISNAAELKGLSQTEINNFAENAKARGLTGKWLIPIRNTTQQPPLQSMDDRNARQKLFMASWTRAERNDSNDTRMVITRIANIRAQKAKLVGFPNYATWKLKDQMAKDPATVDQFFAKLAPAVAAKAKLEAADIQAMINARKSDFKLMPWDWDHYAEFVRKAKYDLDESEVKPYFELNRVLEKGVFYAASQLYGLSFKERKDIPVYHQDIRVFEVFDANGKAIGLFYGDYFKRDNKSGGAWMSNAVGQSYLMGTKPVIYNVCNFTKPAPGEPALISFDDVTTMFHEFGHALHGFFASQRYPLLSGTNVARDFVEFPSQFNEHWALDPKVLNNYAVHYKTGEVISQTLINKIKKAGSFNRGYALTEAVAAALLDMQWHKLSPSGAAAIKDVDVFEKQSLQAVGLDITEVPPRYRSSYFLHIWSNGYAAGYYAYQWTKMLEEDAYSWFKEHGGLTRVNGQRFRDMILSRGNTIDYNTMFKDFRGHAPDIKALQEDQGLPASK